MTLLRSLLSLALAAVTTPLLADTVWLKNGDKLTGSIELFDSGKLLLKTDYAGTITLDAGKIATLESERELLIKQGDFVGERAKSLRPAGQGQVGGDLGQGAEDEGPQVQSGLSQPGVISAVMHTILRPRRGRRKAIGGLRCTTKLRIHPRESRHEPA